MVRDTTSIRADIFSNIRRQKIKREMEFESKRLAQSGIWEYRSKAKAFTL
jgi:hypothetical protein